MVTIIVIASLAAIVLLVLVVGWALNRAMRRPTPETPHAYQSDVSRFGEDEPKHKSARKWGAPLVIMLGVIALLAFVVIPALQSSNVDNGAWQTRAVTPATFIGESITQSTDSNGQWSHKCYIYDIGNNWRVASQDPLDIGQTHNIRGQIQLLTDGTTWFIEEARR